MQPEVGVRAAGAVGHLRARHHGPGAEPARQLLAAGRAPWPGSSSACAAMMVRPGTAAHQPAGSSAQAVSSNVGSQGASAITV
jgi:hypothetical protein